MTHLLSDPRFLRHETGTMPERPARLVRIGARLEVAPSTVYRVLVRNDASRLDHIDRATGAPIRRYEWKRPGELVHVDVKKLGKIPSGGGHRIHGRGKVKKRRVGYVYLHSALDGYPRCGHANGGDDLVGGLDRGQTTGLR